MANFFHCQMSVFHSFPTKLAIIWGYTVDHRYTPCFDPDHFEPEKSVSTWGCCQGDGEAQPCHHDVPPPSGEEETFRWLPEGCWAWTLSD